MDVQNIIRKVNEAREHMRSVCRDALTEALKTFFELHPYVSTVYFTQYTPHFNDGEECVFGVGGVHFSPASWKNITGEYWGEEQEGDLRDFKYFYGTDERIGPKARKSMKDFADLLQDELSDTLKETFGDHVFVRIHPGGIHVQTYNHD